MATHSHWKQVRLPGFPRLDQSLPVDVLVVGGGMTGLSTAYFLKNAGKRVAVVERDRCAQQDTGNTTAHLTCVTDLRIHQLVKSLGRDHAQAVWDAGLAAIEEIAAIVCAENISCEFARVPGYLHASLTGTKDETKSLVSDAELADELGFAAQFVADVPVVHKAGIRFANQAIFHPLMYLSGLAQRVAGDGSYVFEHTEATQFEGGDGKPIRVTCGDHTITCDAVVIATDVPLAGISDTASAAVLQTKLAAYTSYAVGARLPHGYAAQALFWDTSQPYYFLRIDQQEHGAYAVFGGLDHKTGQQHDTSDNFDALAKQLLEILPEAKVDSQWSGQIIESHDGLPLIGETAQGQYVATGYSGNGITFGTLAARMICDAITGRKNPWRELFDPNRAQLRGGMWNYLTENMEYPYYMLKDRLLASEGKSLDDLPPGAGKILKINGQRVAAYRDAAGKTTLLAPECTHMGCIVHWNEAESSWDCPCHGSRFECTGKVIAGPAEDPLEPNKKKDAAKKSSKGPAKPKKRAAH